MWNFGDSSQIVEHVQKAEKDGIILGSIFHGIDYQKDGLFNGLISNLSEVVKDIRENHGVKYQIGVQVSNKYDAVSNFKYITDANGADVIGTAKIGNNFIDNSIFYDFFASQTYHAWKSGIDNYLKTIDLDGIGITNLGPFQGEESKTCLSFNLDYFPTTSENFHENMLCETDKFSVMGDLNQYELHEAHVVRTVQIQTQIMDFYFSQNRARTAFSTDSASFGTAGIASFLNPGWSLNAIEIDEDNKLGYMTNQMLNLAASGIAGVGLPGCLKMTGDDSGDRLCRLQNWLGALSPVYNVFASDSDDEIDFSIFKKALSVRELLKPMIYSSFGKHALTGEPVLTPKFNSQPADLWRNSNQLDAYYLSKSVLVQSNHTFVSLDTEHLSWRNDFSKTGVNGAHFEISKTSELEDFHVPVGSMLLLTDNLSKYNAIVLNIICDSVNNIEYDFYWDDGKSVDVFQTHDFTYRKFKANHLKITNIPSAGAM